MSNAGSVRAVLFTGDSWWVNGPDIITVGVVVRLSISAEFRRDGVMRRAALRHQWVAWERVRRRGRLRVDGRGGGLVADVKGRNYVLADRMESAIEYDDLCRMPGVRAELLGLPPQKRRPDGRSPRWRYRRADWRPESAQVR